MVRRALALLVLVALATSGCGVPTGAKRARASGSTYVMTLGGITMEPTVERNQRIRVTSVKNYVPRRGDIVIFSTPEAWIGDGGPPMTIKRVIALPGDTVSCCGADNSLRLNGVALDESSYRMPGGSAAMFEFDVQVPAGNIWLLGDNRENSPDSSWYEHGQPGAGFVPAANVVAVYRP